MVVVGHIVLAAGKLRPAVEPALHLSYLLPGAALGDGAPRVGGTGWNVSVRVRGVGGQLQAQRFYRRPGVGVGGAGLGQVQQSLCAAGSGGCLVGVLVGEGRVFHAVKVVGNALQQEGVVQHGIAAAADRERGAGVGQTLQRDHRPGTAQLAGAAIEGIPCGAPYHAVHGKPRKPLVRPHRALSIRAKFAVNAYRRDAALVGAHEVEVKLQLPHRCAGRAGAQHTRVLAGAQGRGKQPVGDVVVHLVQLLPCGAPHYPVCR